MNAEKRLGPICMQHATRINICLFGRSVNTLITNRASIWKSSEFMNDPSGPQSRKLARWEVERPEPRRNCNQNTKLIQLHLRPDLQTRVARNLSLSSFFSCTSATSFCTLLRILRAGLSSCIGSAQKLMYSTILKSSCVMTCSWMQEFLTAWYYIHGR